MSPIRILIGFALAIGALLIIAPAALAFEPKVSVSVQEWTSDNGHGYVGVQATGQWAPPSESGKRMKTEFWSEWRETHPQEFQRAKNTAALQIEKNVAAKNIDPDTARPETTAENVDNMEDNTGRLL